MYFNTGFVVILFSLVLAIAAVCPNDPPSRAKKCGKVFRRFGSVAHKDLGKLRELCPKVYGALDCLRDLMNDCEMYRNMGLSMSAEQYQAQKAGIDRVCGTFTNASNQPEVAPVVDVAEPEVSPVVDVAEPEVSPVVDVAEPEVIPDVAEPEVSPGGNNMVCASMLGNCVRKINSMGAQPTLICSKIGEGFACLDDLEETCSRSLAANQVNSIRQSLAPFSQMCNRQNPNTGPTEPERPNGNTVAPSMVECSMMMASCGEQLSAMASVPSELCGKFPEVQSCFDNVVSSCSEVVPRDQLMQVQNSLAPLAQMCGGQGKKRGLEMECQMKMMGCGQIGAQLNTATPQTMCPIMSELADCYDGVLADCSAMLPPQASAMLGNTRQQYTQICGGQGKKRNLATGHTKREMDCVALSQTCIALVNDFDMSNGVETMCSGMRGLLKCMDNVIDKCSHIVPNIQEQISQADAARQQISAACGSVGISGDGYNINIGGDNGGCLAMSQECLAMVSDFDFHQGINSLCGDMRNILQCLESVIANCRHMLPGIEQTMRQVDVARQQIQATCGGNGGTGIAASHSEAMRCATQIQGCSRMLSGIQYDSQISRMCPAILAALSCMDSAMVDCSSVVPADNVAAMEESLAPLRRSCGDVPTDNHIVPFNTVATNTAVAAGGPVTAQECARNVQGCSGMMSRIEFSAPPSVFCPDLMEAMSCMEVSMGLCSHILSAASQSQMQENFRPLMSICEQYSNDIPH